jgi:hypothetical protein
MPEDSSCSATAVQEEPAFSENQPQEARIVSEWPTIGKLQVDVTVFPA